MLDFYLDQCSERHDEQGQQFIDVISNVSQWSGHVMHSHTRSAKSAVSQTVDRALSQGKDCRGNT